jgi:hypothetical protein
MSNDFIEQSGINVDGHVLIKDAETQEVLLDKHNAINFENFAYSVAQTMSGRGEFAIIDIAFGNDGTYVDSVGNIVYRAADVNDISSSLYRETYKKPVSLEVVRHADKPYSDIVCSVTLGYGEPLDQMEFDTATSNEDTDYIFDELALINQDGLYLTHLIFHPIQKSANRKVEVIYTLRIRAGQ